MRFDAINPVTLLPAQPTEAGTPVLSKLPFLLANVVPMPKLPDDGSKPEDKHSKNQAEESEQTEEQEELPEIFKLIESPDFRHLFEYYYFDKNRKLENLKIRFRIRRGIKGDIGLSESIKSFKGFNDIRTLRYGNTMFYHYTRPGKRFAGEM